MVTDIILISAVLVLVGWNVYAAITGRPTISQRVDRYSGRWPIIPFAIGVVCGHLFWPL